MFNLHTHTIRCHHAKGEDRAYVEAAIRAGYTEIGFSDHAPILFPEESDYVSGFRMTPADFEGYVNSVEDLKREYKQDILIHLGLEAEYYPALFEKTLAFYRDYPIEYLIMGQHFVGNEYDASAFYSGRPTDDPAILRRYVKQVLDGLATGAFTYLAHPDLINFTGESDIYRFEAEKLCRGAQALGIPLEANLLGFFEGRNYPNRAFWEVARDVGCDVVIGLDAHAPEVYGDIRTREKLEKWAKKMKLRLLTEPPALGDPRAARQ